MLCPIKLWVAVFILQAHFKQCVPLNIVASFRNVVFVMRCAFGVVFFAKRYVVPQFVYLLASVNKYVVYFYFRRVANNTLSKEITAVNYFSVFKRNHSFAVSKY